MCLKRRQWTLSVKSTALDGRSHGTKIKCISRMIHSCHWIKWNHTSTSPLSLKLTKEAIPAKLTLNTGSALDSAIQLMSKFMVSVHYSLSHKWENLGNKFIYFICRGLQGAIDNNPTLYIQQTNSGSREGLCAFFACSWSPYGLVRRGVFTWWQSATSLHCNCLILHTWPFWVLITRPLFPPV